MILDNYSDYIGVKHLHFCPQLTQELSGYCKTHVIDTANAPFCWVSVPHDQQCSGLSCGAELSAPCAPGTAAVTAPDRVGGAGLCWALLGAVLGSAGLYWALCWARLPSTARNLHKANW